MHQFSKQFENNEEAYKFIKAECTKEQLLHILFMKFNYSAAIFVPKIIVVRKAKLSVSFKLLLMSCGFQTLSKLYKF